MWLKIILIAKITLLIYVQVFSQVQNNFVHLTVEKGLKNSVIYETIQDADGLMWFASKDGLNNYDGYNFKHYSLGENPHLAPLDNVITSLKINTNSVLYCGTASGRIYYLDRKKDEFSLLETKGNNPINSRIQCLLTESNKGLWIGLSTGLYYFDLNNSQIKKIEKISSQVHSLHRDSKGDLWVGTQNGFFYLKNNNGEYNIVQNPKLQEFTKRFIITSIVEDENNRIWIGTQKNGLFVWDTKAEIALELSDEITNSIASLNVKDIVYSSDNIIVGIDGFGVIVINSNLKIQSKYTHKSDVPTSLSSSGVYDIFIDKDKSLWIATYGGGVNYLSSQNKGFTTLRHEPNNENSLSNNTVRAVLEYPENILWFGTKNGINIFNRNTGEWKLVDLNDHNSGAGTIILSFALSKQNYVWAATYGKGLFRIDPVTYKSEKIVFRNKDGKEINSEFLFVVYSDSKGRIWTGGIRDKLSVFNPETGIASEKDMINTNSIIESSWGKFYIGTIDGIFEVDENTLGVSRPKPHNTWINQSRIFCIAEDVTDNGKKLWIGAEGGGFAAWDVENSTYEFFSTHNDAPSNFVYGILFENSDRLWLSTTGGVSCFDNKKKTFTNYDYTDGLSCREFNYGAYGKTHKGEMIFGGQHGCTIFHPDSIYNCKIIPKVVFTGFELFGKTQSIYTEGSPLLKHINNQDFIELNYNQNSVSFDFAAINFPNPQKVRYKWKLENFDNNWSASNSTREAIYTSLPSGEYIFKVKASNHDSLWGDNTRTVTLKINPPFWQTWWAYLSYFIVLSLILYSIIQINKMRLNEKHITEKTRFFINIAHDLRTPLTLIKAPLEQLSRKNETKNDNLTLAQRSVDRLNRLVNQLMDFQKADLSKLQFRPASYQFITFVSETVASFEPLLKEKQISLTRDFPSQDFEMWFDKDKIEKIIYNLLSNAVKYTPNEGDIKIKITKEKKKCRISVKDNGIGIPENQHKQIFKRYYRATNVVNSQETGSGVGLMLVKKLVEIHKGKITFESIENQGTQFEITLPLLKYKKAETALSEPMEETSPTIYPEENTETKNKPDKQKKSVLIVEDNQELLNFMSNVLSTEFNILKAVNGKEGLEIANQKHVDLIVSDIMMPEMNGTQLCNAIKSEISLCHIPLILLTSLSDLEFKIEGLKTGADAYIEKPFDIEHLLAQINNLLVSRQQLKEKFAIHLDNSQDDIATNNLDSEFLKKTKEMVLDNLTNPEFNVEKFASELCMSRPVLYRKLKALTDQSPQDYIRIIRLKEAAHRLKKGIMSISDVAYDVGFSDPKYFSTSFKKMFGCSPSQYK